MLKIFAYTFEIYYVSFRNFPRWRAFKVQKRASEGELTDSLFYLGHGIKSKTILLGSKRFDTKNGERKISCYLVDNAGEDAENLTIFFSKEFGIIINKYISAFSDLAKIENDSIEIQKLVRLVKNDSTFINLDKQYFDRHSPKNYGL